MIYGSVCSGIEAATVAWHPLGWKPAFFSEIEAAPRSILAHHYANTPLHGDFTTIRGDEYGPIDLLVGGTPCQSFSIAGLRGGLDDDRGNLALEYLRLADRTRARWLVWENVPGVLSSNGGRDFGSILGGMAELGYGFAYRILDAQFCGVPQRRRRVFVVGYLGDWRRAAAVLFERHSMSGHPAPSRGKGQNAPTIPSRSTGCGGLGTDFDCDGGLIHETAPCLNAAFGSKLGLDNQHIDSGAGMFVTHPADCITFPARMSATQCASAENVSPSLGALNPTAVAFDLRGREGGAQFEGPHDTANIRAASGGSSRSYVASSEVRRLTPEECEALQGFPRFYTRIPHRGRMMADGPRYKALGNSMAVPCMFWLGQRIQMVEDICSTTAKAVA